MKVLIFVKAFYPIGGIETMTMMLARDFVKNGHQVKILTCDPSYADFDNIEAFCAPTAFKKLQLYNWCDRFYMPEISLEGVWLRLFNPFKKWVVSHNSYYLEKGGAFAKAKLFLIKFTSNIAASKSIAEGLKTKSKVIHYCYDNAIFKLYDENRVYDFVFVGRLVPYKGCELLIRACKKLNRPFTLTIIGDGEERARLEALVYNLGLEKSIRFTGFLQGEKLARMLNKHKVMVLSPIEKEGFGIVVLEALACGCKIIAANAGGLYEAVNQFGHIFPMGDQEALTRLMNEEIEGCSNSTIEYEPNDLKSYLDDHVPNVAIQNYLSFFQ